MSIYTKTGDKGSTTLFGGSRVSKFHPQIEAYGSVDELSSVIGSALVVIKDATGSRSLTQIQRDLHEMMGLLCGASVDISALERRVRLFEQAIDGYDTKLPKLNRFILPQGSEASCRLHIARTVCRRAERAVVAFLQVDNTMGQLNSGIVLKYLNRLSDLLFMMARTYNGKKEITV